MTTLEMLPAREGDCLLLTYRDGDRHRRVLIDGGRAGSWKEVKARLEQIPEDERELELLVITHIDRDHIEGVLKLLGDVDSPVTFKDVWFNGYGHTKAVDDEDFGAVMGEKLTELLQPLVWNRQFGKRSIRLPAAGLPPPVQLEGGLKLTVLSPTADKLVALRPVWERECEEAGLLPSDTLPPSVEEEEQFGLLDVDALCDEPFKPDTSVANGSSIALLAEIDGHRILLGADAHVSVLLDALERLQPGGEPVELSAFKLPHHGSSKNVSIELLQRVRCPRFLVSTSGAQFKHPSRAAIARILKHGGDEKELIFNYRTQFNEIWDEQGLKEDYGYTTTFGTDGSVLIEL